MGSSPLARGALVRKVGGNVVTGIIPACAGSTRPRSSAPRRCGDHPRLRGEHAIVLHGGGVELGSSPLARGALVRKVGGNVVTGIIPACAGSTRPRSSAPRRCGDHPRLRGEHPAHLRRLRLRLGSSPLARGALHLRRPRHQPEGIIPACAGSTSPRACPSPSPRDHPRLRGEHK